MSAEEEEEEEQQKEESFLNEDEYLSTIYNRHVERFLYSHKLSESMLRARWPALPRSLPHAHEHSTRPRRPRRRCVAVDRQSAASSAPPNR